MNRLFNEDCFFFCFFRDTSKITSMYRLFNEDFTKVDPNSNNNGKRTMFAKNFNSDISKWDVSKVTTMERMFSNCLDFNADLSKWDVSRVTSMAGMFRVDLYNLQAPPSAKFRDVNGYGDHTDGSHFNSDIR